MSRLGYWYTSRYICQNSCKSALKTYASHHVETLSKQKYTALSNSWRCAECSFKISKLVIKPPGPSLAGKSISSSLPSSAAGSGRPPASPARLALPPRHPHYTPCRLPLCQLSDFKTPFFNVVKATVFSSGTMPNPPAKGQILFLPSVSS